MFLSRYAPYLYAAMRIVVGLLFACHGSQKILGMPGGKTMPLASMMGAAGMIELVCGILIAAGLFTGYAAFLASGEMAVAYFMQHAPKAALPIANGGELAVLYCFVFLYISGAGSGVWSVDGMRRGQRVK